MIIHAQRMAQVQKRPGKTLNLHLRLILVTERAYNSQKGKKEKRTITKTANWGRGRILISRVITFLDSYTQFSAITQKRSQGIQGNRKGNIKRNIKYLITYLLDLRTVLKMLRKLKKDVEKVKKMMD